MYKLNWNFNIMLTGVKDLDIELLSNFEDDDLISYSLTSKYANQLFNDKNLWMRKTLNFFSKYASLEEIIKYKYDKSWKKYYIEMMKFIRQYPDLNTGLYSASEKGGLLLVKYFLENGGKNYDDVVDSALGMAIMNNHLNVVKYFVEKKKNNNMYFEWAVLCGQLEIVKYYNEERGYSCENVLSYAISGCDLNMVKYVVENGAYIDEYEIYKANKYKQLEIFKYLSNIKNI